MKLITLHLSVAIATFTIVGATTTGINCTAEFKSMLENALAKKENCDINGFYDCCEVS